MRKWRYELLFVFSVVSMVYFALVGAVVMTLVSELLLFYTAWQVGGRNEKN